MSQERLSTHDVRTHTDAAQYHAAECSHPNSSLLDAVDLDMPDTRPPVGNIERTSSSAGRILAVASACAVASATLIGGCAEWQQERHGVVWAASDQLVTDAQRLAIREGVQSLHCTGPFRGKTSRILINGRNTIESSGAIAPKRKIVISLRSIFEDGTAYVLPSTEQDAHMLNSFCATTPHSRVQPDS